MKLRHALTALLVLAAPHAGPAAATREAEHHYLYVAEPGIRNYVEYGGVGVLVFERYAISPAGSRSASTGRAPSRRPAK